MKLRQTKLLGLLIAVVTGVALLSAGHAEEHRVREYQIKAAFMYNFAKFVEWPEGTFADDDSAVNLCVFGDDPFGVVLDKTVEGKTAQGRGLAIRRLSREKGMKSCQVVFIASDNRRRLPVILNNLRESAVLTVGETDGFARAGGMINFVIEEDRVRFDINTGAAKRAGLKISSKLLKLARTVRDK